MDVNPVYEKVPLISSPGGEATLEIEKPQQMTTSGEETPQGTERIFIFHHIPKTAGSTFLLSYLPTAFSRSRVAIVPGDTALSEPELERLATLPPEEKTRYKVIAGHHVGRLRAVFPGALWLTLVRDPVERAVSSYLHALFHPPARKIWGTELERDGLGVAEYVEQEWFLPRSNELGGLQNLQAKVLLGPDFEEVLHDEGQTKSRLQSRYSLVGYTEAFELFVFLLHVYYGFPLVLFQRRLVRQERATFRITAEEATRIERVNKYDRLLYRAVREEFDRRAAEALTPPVEALYRRYLAKLEEFQEANKENEHAAAIYSDEAAQT